MEVCVQLKVCEGCGCLWLRAENQGVYCCNCQVKLKDFPAPETRKRRGRPRRKPPEAVNPWTAAEAAGGAE